VVHISVIVVYMVNKLVEEIIKPILNEIPSPKIKKVVGIYGGRFQPFGPHHYKTYKWLAKIVDEAYITTSNIKKPPRHPMNFKEKVRHMSKMGVPSSKIIEEKSPYKAINLTKKYNPETTAFVYVFGAKDAGRLGGSGKYFQDYKKNKKNLKGYEENGYYLTAPHVSISVGGKEVSGTSMRELLGSDKFDDSERAKLFKSMFGYYDKGVFKMMTNKFKKLFEVNESLPTKVSDKYKKVKPADPKDKKKFKQFIKHHRYHSGPHIDGLESEPETYDFDDSEESKPGVQKRKKDKKKKGYEPVTENWLEKGSKKDRALKLKISKLYSKAFKQMPGSPAQEKIKKEIDKLRNQLSEGVDLPIEIGDTVLMGKFKNKKVVIKTISWNEKGDLLINGKSAMRMRIPKKPNIFDEDTIGGGYPNKEDMKKIKKRVNKARSQSDSNKEYQYDKIEEFLTTIDMNELITEATNTTKGSVDDGPGTFYVDYKNYKKHSHSRAKELGYEVIGYIMHDNVMFRTLQSQYPKGPINSVTYLPAGAGTGKSPNHQEEYTGTKGWNKWATHINRVAGIVGWKFIDFLEDTKDIAISDSKETQKVSKEEEPEEVKESVLTKEWWDEVLTEVSAKTKLFKQKLMRRGIKIRYDKTKAQKDLMTKYGGQGEVVAKKFGLRKAWYAVPKKGFKKDTKPVLKINKQEMEKLHKDKVLDKGNLKVVFSEDWWKENLLTEGGAYGHMAHPFDDKDLTFGDLKKIIENGLGGTLNREDNVTEKLDGQNIMVSWKDGKLIAARNKGHIKNGGKTALDTKGIISKFKGRGDISDAFTFAMKDLEKAIKGLSDKQKEKIFNNGYNFMNMEVMWPKSANVIDYDKAELVFHGALKYDDSGTVKGEVKGSGRILAGMIKQVNMHIGKKYKIGKPVFLDVPKHQDFGKMKGKFLGRLKKLQSQFDLKESDTLGLYHQKWWEIFVYLKWPGDKKTLSNKIKEGLVKRWAFFDKKYTIPMMRNDIKDEKQLEWVLKFDKKDHAAQVKKNMKPFEELFFEVGAEILKNVKGFMAANPDKAVQGIRKRLDKAISSVRSGGDIKKLNTLRLQLDKLNSIGGVDSIVPSEGIVFKYKGNTYKFTGAFAPINQIAGLISF